MNPRQIQTLAAVATIFGVTFVAVNFLRARQAEGSEPPPGGGGNGGGGTVSVVNLPRIIFKAVR